MLRIVKIMLVGWIPVFAAAAAGDATNPSALFTVSPQTTAVLEPLRPDGSVDYVAVLNQRFSQGVTPQNNGYVLWLRVMGTNGLPQSVRKQTLAMCGAEELNATDIGWTGYSREPRAEQGAPHLWKAEDDPGYVAYLNSQENILDLATQAAAKPWWWSPYVSSTGSMIMVLLPQLNPMRGVSNTLCDRALLRAGQGDFDGFLSDVMTVKRLSRRTSGPFIVCDLVAIGIDVLADRTIAAAAGAGIFSTDQCDKLAEAMDVLEPMPPLWETIDVGERWAALDWTESIATGNLERLSEGGADGNRQSRIFKAVNVDSVDWNAVLQQINGDYDQIIETMKVPSPNDRQIARRNFDRKLVKLRARSPAHERLAKEPEETNEAYTQRVTDGILSVLLPSVWHYDDTCRCGEMEGKMARAVLAAAQYRADKGKWPDRLGDLTPEYLAEAPKDIFSATGEQPVRYQMTHAGVCLHARGVQGNDIAEGAR